jgi:hypothetical protein
MEKQKIHNTNLKTTRRGDTAGAAPGCPFISTDIMSFITMMKRESFIPAL